MGDTARLVAAEDYRAHAYLVTSATTAKVKENRTLCITYFSRMHMEIISVDIIWASKQPFLITSMSIHVPSSKHAN